MKLEFGVLLGILQASFFSRRLRGSTAGDRTRVLGFGFRVFKTPRTPYVDGK